MKSSILIAATSAVLAMAGPLEKRKYVTTIETYYATVTVTGGAEAEAVTPVPTPVAQQKQRPETIETQAPAAQSVVVVTETYVPQPAPEPTTPTPVVVYVTETPSPSPEPTTQTPTTKEAVASPSSIAAPAPTAPSDNDFQGSALYHHNIHRTNHSSPEITWDSKIAGYAGSTAAKCVFAHDMDEGDGGYGQNIAMWAVSSGAEDLGEAGAIKMATTDMWYNGEFRNYHSDYYGKKSPDMSGFDSWGHYTQVIWKSTTRLGCAVQFCPKGKMVADMDAWYMVCNYGPPGNIADNYGENVLEPLGEPTVMGV